MEQDILRILEEHSKKLDTIEKLVKKIRSYLFWTVMVSLILFVLPLIGLLYAIPKFLSVYSQAGL